jgi:hypothetical protein
VDRWEVNYAMVNTPEELLGQYEPQQLHLVEHIPEHMRLTTWAIERDRALEAQMDVKLELARAYYAQCIAEFAATHPSPDIPPITPTAPWQPPLELIDTQQPPRVLGHLQEDGRALMLPEEPAAPAVSPETAPALNIGQINKRLGIFDVKATTATALGIPTVKDRSAVHLPASSFTDFCNGLIAHIADVRDSFQAQP